VKTKQIIDAVVAGANALALPAHPTYKYHRPLSLVQSTGVRVPALAVSPAIDKPELLDTSEGYAWTHRLLVTWYAGQMSAMTLGKADELMAAATLDHMSLLIGLFSTWADAVPGLAFQSEATLGEVHYGVIEGGIWTSEINLSITHWEN
jgi:hypothetical protein